MLQIVHDVAPGAKLAFRTGFINASDFALGIKQLQKDSCNVIVDDVTYITEPFYQDGVVAQAVDDVACKGVAYFSAAGNYGNQSYEGVFNPAPAPNGISGTAHNFGGGDIYQTYHLTARHLYSRTSMAGWYLFFRTNRYRVHKMTWIFI